MSAGVVLIYPLGTEERKPSQSLNLNISLWITVKSIFMERHNSSGVTDPKT